MRDSQPHGPRLALTIAAGSAAAGSQPCVSGGDLDAAMCGNEILHALLAICLSVFAS